MRSVKRDPPVWSGPYNAALCLERRRHPGPRITGAVFQRVIVTEISGAEIHTNHSSGALLTVLPALLGEGPAPGQGSGLLSRASPLRTAGIASRTAGPGGGKGSDEGEDLNRSDALCSRTWHEAKGVSFIPRMSSCRSALPTLGPAVRPSERGWSGTAFTGSGSHAVCLVATLPVW